MISIIDDDENVRRATKSLVRSLGYDAEAFASAEEFLNSVLLGTTSCLILDVQMPGMTGIELQSRLIAEGRRLPLIFITAYPDANIRECALNRGAVGFFGKPLNEQDLIDCLDEALSAGGPGPTERS